MITTDIDVRLPDCDAMGIVHHAVYPVWYEMGRLDFFAQCGFGYERSRALGIDPAMVNLNMNYGMPAVFPERLRLQTRCTLLQGKKIGFSYALYAPGQDQPIATATSFHIWVRGGKSVNIQLEVPEMFAAYAGQTEPEDAGSGV